MMRCRHDAPFTYNTVSFDTSSGHVAVFCDKTGVLRLIAKFIQIFVAPSCKRCTYILYGVRAGQLSPKRSGYAGMPAY